MQNKNASSSAENYKLLSIGEAANYLGISIDTLRRWGKKEKIETYRSPGGHRYYKKQDLDNLFGTKYVRTEPTIRKTIVKKELKEEVKKPEVSEEVITPKVEPKEEVKPVPEMKSYNEDKLVVPSFSPQRMYSKYDKMLSNVSNIVSVPLTGTTPAENNSSILVPNPPTQTQPTTTEKPVLTTQTATPQTPTEKKQLSITFNLKNTLIVILGLILVISLILFIIGLATPKVLSPVP